MKKYYKFKNLPIRFDSKLEVLKIAPERDKYNPKKIKTKTHSPRGSHSGFVIELLLREGQDIDEAMEWFEKLLKEGGKALLWAIYNEGAAYDRNILVRLHMPYEDEIKEEPKNTLLLVKVGDGKSVNYSSKETNILGAEGAIAYGTIEAPSRTGMHWDIFGWVLGESPKICASYVHHTSCDNVHRGEYCVGGKDEKERN